MKINDFIFRFKARAAVSSGGICRVRTFVNSQGALYVLLSELDENPSASVTNALELIVAQLLQQQKIPQTAAVIEHYPKQRFFSETFDLIQFSSDGAPSWTAVSRGAMLQALECPQEEFADYREDPRIRAEI